MFKMSTLGKLAGAGVISLMMLSSFGAQARTLQQIMESKTLIVGVNPNLPPLGVYDAKNQISGFDATVAQKIADQMGVKLQLVAVGSNDRVPFIMADKIDAVMGE